MGESLGIREDQQANEAAGRNADKENTRKLAQSSQGDDVHFDAAAHGANRVGSLSRPHQPT